MSARLLLRIAIPPPRYNRPKNDVNNYANQISCSLAESSSVTANGNTLTLTLTIMFAPSFAGNRLFYLVVRSNTLNSNWQVVGNVSNLPLIYYTSVWHTDTNVEYRFFAGTQHFMTVIVDSNGALAIRPHPGRDVNGWGSTAYLEPFLPGAVLHGAAVPTITVNNTGPNSGISADLSGPVSREASGS